MVVSNNLGGKTSDEHSVSQLESPYFLSTEHPLECFSFYFIFGPDEVADQLTVLIRKKDNSYERILWELTSSWMEDPTEWIEGRVEVRPDDIQEEHEYRVGPSSNKKKFVKPSWNLMSPGL